MASKSHGGRNILSPYLVGIRKEPMLTAAEEFDLARCWREHRDRGAAHKLIASHLRLVVRVARGFLGYGLALEDLVAEGNLGLIQAVEKFEPERGFRLATYAIWWIKASMRDLVLRSASLVRLGTTAAQKKLFFRLRGLKSRLGVHEGGDLAPEIVAAIAAKLGVTEAEVVEMNGRMGGDLSLNRPPSADTELEFQDLLIDESPNQEARFAEFEERQISLGLLALGMERLNDRERHIVVARKLADQPRTLEALSADYGISRERVRQIEERALEKLQASMRKMRGGRSGAALNSMR